MFEQVKALVFDVFGTVVDWREGIAREAGPFLAGLGRSDIDAHAFADAWRARYQPAMEEIRSGRRGFTRLDLLHRENLEQVLQAEPELSKDKVLKKAVKDVAKDLGNTPTVCSKYYIHPQVVELFESDKLIDYLRRHDADPADKDQLTPTEHLVLDMLVEV